MPNPYHDDKGQFSDAGGGVAVSKSFSPASESLKLPSISFPVAPLGECFNGSAKVGQSLAAAGKKVKYAYDPKADGGQGHMWVLVQAGEGWQAVDSYYGLVNDAQFYKPKYAFDDYEKIQELMPTYKEVFEIDPKTHKPTGRKVIENKMNNSEGGNLPVEDCQDGGKNGKRWGKDGKCYVHNDSEEGIKAAMEKAMQQGRAIEISKHMDAGAIAVPLGEYGTEFHAVRIFGNYDSGKTRTPVDVGIWKIEEPGLNGVPEIKGYEFNPALFTEKQAKTWLTENKIEFEDYDFTPAKSTNAGQLSYEYLKAIYDLVMAHPGIWSQIKDEVHVQARGSAGGQLRGRGGMMGSEFVKSENAAFIDGDYIETEEYIDAPTVFAKEGVFTGSNGRASLPRFLGASATPTHIETDTLRPDDRWLGHAVNVTARDDKRDIFGYTRYYKQNLTTDELSKIRNKQYPDGSIGFFTPIRGESGEFNGKKYEAVEVGPYVITEYATMFDGTKGACSRDEGCGPFQNSAVVGEIESDDVLRLINGTVKKCPRKLMNHSGDIDNMDESELKKILNEAVKTGVKEGLGDLPERVSALEKQKNEAPKLAEDPTIKTLIATVGQLAESVKLVNAALPDIKSFKTEQEAAKLATQRAAFAKHLNAAHQPTGKPDDEFEKAWNAASADPLGRDVWLANHPEVKVALVEKRDFTGKILNSGGAEFDMQAERQAHREKTGQVI
jgi:hypothetical protein